VTGLTAADQPVGEAGEAAAEAESTAPTSVAATEAQPEQTPALSEEEQRELEEMLGIVKDFQNQTKSYKKEIQLIIERKYEEQRKSVVGSYDRAIAELEKEENRRRLDAIEVFEKFLIKYPNDRNFTPGALWRLAELYFEKSKIDYTAEESAFDQALAAYNRGETQVEPVAPMPHFAIALPRSDITFANLTLFSPAGPMLNIGTPG